jgi:hypothetical protein
MFILTPFAKLCNNSEDGAPIETPQRLALKKRLDDLLFSFWQLELSHPILRRSVVIYTTVITII